MNTILHLARRLFAGAFVHEDGTLRNTARILPDKYRDDALFFHHVIRWVRDRGDELLRLEYPLLNQGSLVVDLGGYHGDFAAAIVERFSCHVMVFEPLSRFQGLLRERFASDSRVAVLPVALSGSDEHRRIYFHDDGTSLFRPGAVYEHIACRRFSTYMREANISHISLLKINIEGAEFELLDEIIASGWHLKIDNIQVQFHRDQPHAYRRMMHLYDALALSHVTTYDYPFVWVNFRRRHEDGRSQER